MSKIDRRNLSTAERLAEYIDALRSRGIPVKGATVEGRTIHLDLSNSPRVTVNPADLVDP
jgi:hypothetical protein